MCENRNWDKRRLVRCRDHDDKRAWKYDRPEGRIYRSGYYVFYNCSRTEFEVPVVNVFSA